LEEIKKYLIPFDDAIMNLSEKSDANVNKNKIKGSVIDRREKQLAAVLLLIQPTLHVI
jgi:hypothetical protein